MTRTTLCTAHTQQTFDVHALGTLTHVEHTEESSESAPVCALCQACTCAHLCLNCRACANKPQRPQLTHGVPPLSHSEPREATMQCLHTLAQPCCIQCGWAPGAFRSMAAGTPRRRGNWQANDQAQRGWAHEARRAMGASKGFEGLGPPHTPTSNLENSLISFPPPGCLSLPILSFPHLNLAYTDLHALLDILACLCMHVHILCRVCTDMLTRQDARMRKKVCTTTVPHLLTTLQA